MRQQITFTNVCYYRGGGRWKNDGKGKPHRIRKFQNITVLFLYGSLYTDQQLIDRVPYLKSYDFRTTSTTKVKRKDY